MYRGGSPQVYRGESPHMCRGWSSPTPCVQGWVPFLLGQWDGFSMHLPSPWVKRSRNQRLHEVCPGLVTDPRLGVLRST